MSAFGENVQSDEPTMKINNTKDFIYACYSIPKGLYYGATLSGNKKTGKATFHASSQKIGGETTGLQKDEFDPTLKKKIIDEGLAEFKKRTKIDFEMTQ